MRLKTSLSVACVAAVLAVGLTACVRSGTPAPAGPGGARLEPATPDMQPTGPAARGEALARLHCSGCHAIGATGASPRADAPAFRDLGERYPPEALEEAFAEGILVGHPDMPQFRFETPDIDAIVAYLHAVQGKGRG